MLLQTNSSINFRKDYALVLQIKIVPVVCYYMQLFLLSGRNWGSNKIIPYKGKQSIEITMVSEVINCPQVEGSSLIDMIRGF